MRIDKLRAYMNEHEEEMIEDIKTLVRIPSEKGEARPGMPFGEEPAKALEAAGKLFERYGFLGKNYDNYAVTADLNDRPKKLDILAHLDVVPAGEGWTVTEPFEPKMMDGMLYGRGTADDKGPAVAAMYAMRAIKELGMEPEYGVRLVLGSDEECGSSDLAYYYKIEKEAEYTFSPDADFPVINVEKGGLHTNFEHEFSGGDASGEGAEILEIKAGTKVNVVPGKARARVAKISGELLKRIADETTKMTGVSFLQEEKEKGIIDITACGVSAHAASPETGNNALTALLYLLSRLPLAKAEMKLCLSYLTALYPHGDYEGKALGVAREDEVSGKLTLSLTMLSYDGKLLAGSTDCRAPLSANDENTRDIINEKLKAGGFTTDGQGMYEGHYVPADTPLVSTLLSCYKDITGRDEKPLSMGGGTYVHHLQSGVAFGCAVAEVNNRMHGADEFVDIAHLKECAVIFAEAILRLCA